MEGLRSWNTYKPTLPVELQSGLVPVWMSEQVRPWLQAGDVIRGSHGELWAVNHSIGSGTCCQVYEAQQGNRRVAIKCYKSGDRYKAAHDREALLLSLLSETPHAPCKHLVRMVDDCTHEDQACLVQELLDISVRQLVIVNQNNGRLSLSLIQNIARDVIRGLHHMHKSGFVHGDIKPANILWSPHNEVFKLIDFGLSFHVADKTCGRLQSVRYRAPEVCHWNDSIHHDYETGEDSGINPCHYMPGTAADMWSVGCMLMDLFNGRDTAETMNPVDSIAHHDKNSSAKRVQLQLRDKDGDDAVQLTALLEDLVKRMLAFDAANRITFHEVCNHDFLQQTMVPSYVDLLVLPSRVLRFLNIADKESLKTAAMYSDLKESITEECAKYGKVEACRIPKHGNGCGNVFVQFSLSHEAISAFSHLCRRLFDNHALLITYFPLDCFLSEKFC